VQWPARLFSSQVAQSIASQCIDLYGGCGLTREYLVEKFYRDIKTSTLYERTSDIELQPIAKNLLT
jgi:alkylation response protein AidB-like acyl-CoA dehydrogenase